MNLAHARTWLKALGHQVSTFWEYAEKCSTAHAGTFDGWCWEHVAHAAAVLADLLDPIKPRRPEEGPG